MSGKELIAKIVKECERDKQPPTDAAILNRLREMLQISRESTI